MKLLFVVLLATVATADRFIPMCKPHTRYEVYCNTCKCSPDGRTALCTDMDCDLSIWNEDGTLKADLESLSAEESKTLKNTDVMCEPLSTFKDYCNACRCSSDGKNAACTSMSCDLSVWNKDGTVKGDSESLPVEELESEEPKDLCQTITSEDGSKFQMCY